MAKKKKVELPGGGIAPARFVTRQYPKARALYFDEKGKFTSKINAVSKIYYQPKPVWRDQYGQKLTEEQARQKKVKIINLDKDGQVRAKVKIQSRIQEPVIDTKTEPTAQEMFNRQVNSLVSDAQITPNFRAYVMLTVRRKIQGKQKLVKRYIELKGNSYLNWENFSWELWQTFVEILGPYLDSPQLLFLVLMGNVGIIVDLDNSAQAPEFGEFMDNDDFTQDIQDAIKLWKIERKRIINKYWNK